MGDQIRKAWDKNVVVVCMVLAVLMGVAFGASLSTIMAQEQASAAQESQRKEREESQLLHSKERATLTRNHRAEKKYLREQLAERNATIAKQSDQLAALAGKASDGNKAAIQIIDKQTPKAATK